MPLRFSCLFISLLAFLLVPLHAQVPGASTNMVSGTTYPNGDPYLQRQNEPSMAVSSRNPLHLLAGNNDYRSVDIPTGDPADPTGDAWVGVFKSLDGGLTWSSTLLPGFPQDRTPLGLSSPLKQYSSGADINVRAGANGMFYYSGIAFQRGPRGISSIFLTRFIDDNNIEGSDPIRYLGTVIIDKGDPQHFVDKPALAVDQPRGGSKSCVIPAGVTASGAPIAQQTFRGGRIFVAYTRFQGDEDATVSDIMVSHSNDCGATWSTPLKVNGPTLTNQGPALAVNHKTGMVYIVWRVFKNTGKGSTLADVDSLWGVALRPQDNQVSPAVPLAVIHPFDQGTSSVSFRTNTYPALTTDQADGVYLSWAQRNAGTPAAGGDARILILSANLVFEGDNEGDEDEPKLPKTWKVSAPVVVDNYNGRGHQIMPALAFSSGKLTAAWYDFRYDDQFLVYTPLGGGTFSSHLQVDGAGPVFSSYIADPAPLGSTGGYARSARRHTLDVRAAQASPGIAPVFKPSVQVAQYAFGEPDATAPVGVVEQLEKNPPNLPIFQSGTVAFVGDYIDVAGPTFVPKGDHGNTWRFNDQPGDPDYTHVVWTDNRDVVQPPDGNWAHYTPVHLGLDGQPLNSSGSSIYDPTQPAPMCMPGFASSRNQNIYTATLSPGIIVGAKGNAKPLSKTLQREFAVTVQNPGPSQRSYRLSVPVQPPGGSASFLQFPPKGQGSLTTIDIVVAPFASAARSVYITSIQASASVPINVTEITAPQGVPVPAGQSSSVLINGDIANPSISNPSISNPSISNPSISNVEVYNPSISNPSISNSSISNPSISNPSISNPSISNPSISNPSISNPSISNPSISNPSISNPSISNPSISNPSISNPSISNVAPGDILDASQIVTNTGNTAASYNIQLVSTKPLPSGTTAQLLVSAIYTTPIANGCQLGVEAHYIPLVNQPNPTFVQTPAYVPLLDPAAPTFSLAPGEQALITLRIYHPPAQPWDPFSYIVPAVVPNSVNTNSATQTPVLSLFITTPSPAPANAGAGINIPLTAIGGIPPYTWSAAAALPGTLAISGATLSGNAPAAPGAYPVSIQAKDSGNRTTVRTVSLVVTGMPLSIPTTPKPLEQGVNPNWQFTAANGSGNYTWSSSNLPNGLTLSTSGLLSGAPAAVGPYSATITVRDNISSQQTSITLSGVVASPLALTPPPSTDGEVGFAYTPQFTATGGTTNKTWSATGLPSGILLNPSTGVLSGSPGSPGSSTVNLQVTDDAGGIATASFPLTVHPALTLPGSAADAEWGVPYSQQIQVSGGSGGAVIFTQLIGIPALTISPSGLISGTPTSASGLGLLAIRVRATDGVGTVTGDIYVHTYSQLSLSGGAGPQGEVGYPYNSGAGITIGAMGGRTATLVWGGTALAPTGLTFTVNNPSSSATISGVPSRMNNANILFTVTDGIGSAMLSLPIPIAAALTITTPVTLPGGQTGVAYSTTLASTGGYNVQGWYAASPLPAGFSVDPSGNVSTTGVIAPGTYILPIQERDTFGSVERDFQVVFGP